MVIINILDITPCDIYDKCKLLSYNVFVLKIILIIVF